MILHIVDDEKFVDMAYREFEKAYSGNNDCMVLSDKKELQYVKDTPCDIIDVKKENLKDIVKTIKKYDAVVLHGLNDDKLTLLKYLPKNVTVVWIGMGYDYYDLIVRSNLELLDDKTRELYIENYPKKSFIRQIIHDESYVTARVLKTIISSLAGGHIKLKSLEKIDYFAPVMNSEYDMIQKSMYGNFHPKFLDWNYGTLEDDLIRGYKEAKITSNNILLGNNAKYENNHLEVFELLSNLNIDKRKIITPLSYGNHLYRKNIVREGQKLFGEHFVPLVDFMSIDEYINTIKSCSTVIMNHIRQQGLGNIVTMLYIGATVFLKKQNPVYSFLKNENAIVFMIEELEQNPSLLNYRLSKQEIQRNRVILEKYWSREIIYRKTKKFIRTIDGSLAFNKKQSENK